MSGAAYVFLHISFLFFGLSSKAVLLIRSNGQRERGRSMTRRKDSLAIGSSNLFDPLRIFSFLLCNAQSRDIYGALCSSVLN